MNSRPPNLCVRENVSLASYTTLEVGGPARYFVEARSESQIAEALEFASTRSLPVFILGGGSNILVSDQGFPGLVVKIALRGIRHEGAGRLTAASGEDWDAFVRGCVEQGFAGIECLSGIPGTVGGTPVQNVGAYGQEVSEVISSVRVFERDTRRIMEIDGKDCGFAYRSSLFNTTGRDRHVVLAVSFSLQPGGAPRIVYSDLKRVFENRSADIRLAEVRNAVLQIRAGKSMLLQAGDPDSKSAGSFFKNPVVSEKAAQFAEDAARTLGELKEGGIMPRYPVPGGLVKLSAAWLIERGGFPRGYVRGRAGLSSKHALALINRGGASAADIVALMEEIRAEIRRVFHVGLVTEPMLVGFGKEPVR